jgi:hypothetical protein
MGVSGVWLGTGVLVDAGGGVAVIQAVTIKMEINSKA